MLIRTYDDLEFYVKMFRDGNLNLLVISGDGGLSKSHTVNEIIRDFPHAKILSHVSPLSLYIIAYSHIDEPIIIDDIDSLLYSNDNISLIKQLTESTEEKEVAWQSTTTILEEKEIPCFFKTKSRCLIICNSVERINRKIASLLDRGLHIEFSPTVAEKLAKIEKIIKSINNGLNVEQKAEVFSIIKEYAKFGSFSIRTYLHGLSLYKQTEGRGWKNKLLKLMNVKAELRVMGNLLVKFPSDKERLDAWEYLGWSRRGFYRYKKSFVSDVPVCQADLEMSEACA